jgi:hypothetical protein
LFILADVPRIRTAVVQSCDLATLNHRQASRFDGQRVRVGGDLESEPGDAGGFCPRQRIPHRRQVRLALNLERAIVARFPQDHFLRQSAGQRVEAPAAGSQHQVEFRPGPGKPYPPG